MQNDKTTLKDLSIFNNSGEDVASLIDRTTTAAGREALRQYIRNPPSTYERLMAMQATIRWWSRHADQWTKRISNGTVVLLEKFFDTADTDSLGHTGVMMIPGAFLQKLFNRNEYSFVEFSLTQITDLLRGCMELVELRKQNDLPDLLEAELKEMEDDLDQPLIPQLLEITKQTSFRTMSRLAFRARRELKNPMYRLIERYARLDAWQSMGAATKALKWNFPTMTPAFPVHLKTKGLFHPLLATPIPYEINFDSSGHFLLLTGANMSGKTTFMRALGVAALLAHLGMGVPAETLELSFLDGIITNMAVEDSLLKGESYFFAEVQRIKSTAQRIAGDRPHLVLMDELFKGTNVHDAYECTRAVVEGLLKHPHHLMVLSTHIHEVARHFEGRAAMHFAYFVTLMDDGGGFRFSYELRQGISSDRIGYRILLQQGVIDLLNHSEP
jgi:DNA mismatch repair ATPase MutS